jgi:hypothetical protein
MKGIEIYFELPEQRKAAAELIEMQSDYKITSWNSRMGAFTIELEDSVCYHCTERDIETRLAAAGIPCNGCIEISKDDYEYGK